MSLKSAVVFGRRFLGTAIVIGPVSLGSQQGAVAVTEKLLWGSYAQTENARCQTGSTFWIRQVDESPTLANQR